MSSPHQLVIVASSQVDADAEAQRRRLLPDEWSWLSAAIDVDRYLARCRRMGVWIDAIVVGAQTDRLAA